MKKTNINYRKVLRLIIKFIGSLLIYGSIVFIVLWWQQRDMLKNNQSIQPEYLNLLSISGDAFHYKFANSEKTTLIYFFAPWCNICHYSIDNLEALKEANKDQLQILIVALDWKSIEEVDDFLKQHKLTSPVLLGTQKTQSQFKISAFPSYYLISKQGKVKMKSKGYTTEIGMKLAVSLND